MDDRKIIKLEVIDNNPYRMPWIVGNAGGVTKIIDTSIEYQDAIHPAYEVYVGDKVISRIENCPVVVEYEV